MKHTVILLVIFTLIFTSCTTEPQAKCANIAPMENAPFTFEEAMERGIVGDNGCYYGSCDQKLPGTPDNWVHISEGSRSAAWCAPSDNIKECDC